MQIFKVNYQSKMISIGKQTKYKLETSEFSYYTRSTTENVI